MYDLTIVNALNKTPFNLRKTWIHLLNIAAIEIKQTYKTGEMRHQ